MTSIWQAPCSGQANATASCGLLVFDLDKFKALNDTLGHGAGDRMLVVLAERLQEQLQDIDLLARIGGDEFTAVAMAS